MTARAGETFGTVRAVRDIEALLAGAVPAAGPTADEGEPDTGEWSATAGEGFRIVPLWESDGLVGVYGPEWQQAEEAAAGHLAALVGELDRRWGTHRTAGMRVPIFRHGAGESLPPLYRALCDRDCLGDLTVWGPVEGRWIAISLNQCDGDAPMILVAVVADRPIVELDDGE
ncbi:hypothetical protein [Streptomyces gelaticus]|uniref:hypothetical protein n=1 Tax=Streptomyces gelaticus TaxID=285446 RepID=UPI001674F961|nr:hypothetical protein [Streptomyces gelaticus]